MSIEAMKLALEALESNHEEIVHYWALVKKNNQAITALRQAIEQAQKQEPVAWADDCRIELVTAIHFLSSDFENALYAFREDTEARKSAEGSIAHARGVAVKWNRNGRASPPQRPPLTSKQIREIEVDVALNQSFDYPTTAEQFARAIEAAHGITGEKK